MPSTFRIILTLLLALSSLGAVDLIRPQVTLQSSAEGLTIDFDFTGIPQEKWIQMLGDPHAFHEYGYGVAGQPGDAALPMLTQLIPVSSMSEPAIAGQEKTESILADMAVKASPSGHLDSDPIAPMARDYDWNTSTRSIPDQLILGEPIAMKGQWFLPLTIHPIRLSETSGELVLATELTVSISGAALESRVQLDDTGSIRSVALLEDRYPSRGRYLIITPVVFNPYLSYLADWKRQMGYDVDIFTTNQAGSSASTIKSFIQERWDVPDTRPDYLLIIGDEDQGIPGHYVQNPEGTNLVTDHPYGLMEGDDSFPEIMVGRLSVDTVSELAAFMAKIINYEKTPYMDVTSWFRRALMISTNTGAASAQATKEWVATKLEENGYTQVYTAYHPYQTTTNYISNPINQGVGFVNYRGFGMYSGWFGPDFTSSDVYSLISNGAKTPVITSVVCGGGNFAAWEDPCFGEVWTRVGSSSVPRGAVAFFGPSELYTHTQFNNVIDIGIYSGIFDQGMHTLGDALWNGKFELWRNYHQNSYFPFGQTPEFYHHVYNLLGDPGMQLWTDVPEELTVSFPESRSTGDNSVSVGVVNSHGHPVEGAYVALHNDELSIGGYTGADGAIQIPFEVEQTGEIALTITGKNLLPVLETINIEENTRPLLMTDWSMSSGALLTAGETQSMRIELFNPGEDLSNVSLSFSTDASGVSLTENVVLDLVGSMETTIVESAQITTDLQMEHGTPIDLTMEVLVDGQRWFLAGQFLVQSPVLQISDLQLNAGNLMAGDSAEISIELINSGGVASEMVTLTPLDNPLITVQAETIICPPVALDGAAVMSDPVPMLFSDQIFPGERVQLQFECEQSGIIDTLTAFLEVGTRTSYAPSAVDGYGYRMFDHLDLSYSKAQPYNWLEIDPNQGGDGTVLSLSDYYEEADESITLLLPFTVQYYGKQYNQITVCTNGWAAFGDQDMVNFHNRIIPSPIGPTAMLAPFWDDLITHIGYVIQGSSEEDGTFILEWHNVRHLDNSIPLSFQIIIYDTDLHPTGSGDNDIKFQYRQYGNQDIAHNFNTIGIESPDSEIGLQAAYNGYTDESLPQIGPGTALLFSTDRGERLPAAMASLSQTTLNFVQNPWTNAQDSIVITNAGESPMAYSFSLDSDEINLQPAISYPADPTLTKSSPDVSSDWVLPREGSDAYGYTWVRSDEEGAPAYNWIDIESPSNFLAYEGDPDDGSSSAIPLGFDFPFYDDVYSAIHVGYNGSLSFESPDSPWSNTFLPNAAAPPALLAPWWEDLNNDTGPLGELYFWTNDYNQCIITYKDFPKWGTTNTYTFQVILDPFGKIVYQYQELQGATSSVTVGMQNPDKNMGLLIHFNQGANFPEESAITIRRPLEWFSASGWNGMIPGGESASLIVNIQTQNLEQGHYEVPMTLSTSADNLPEVPILLSLDLIHGQPPLGDVNQDYLLDINDLMKMLDFILLIDDMNEDQFGLADISADDNVNVIDVILLIEEILNTE